MRWPLFVLLSTALSGCIFRADGSNSGAPQARGDITFLWSFDGKSCSQASDVQTVHLTVNGPHGAEKLDADGQYNCNPAGVDGIRLLDFSPGTYTFTVDAWDATKKTIYTATGTVRVDGDAKVNVTLYSVNEQGLVQVYWSFGPTRQACKDAGIPGPEGVSKVSVRVDSRSPQTFPCTDTSGNVPVEGIAVKLDPGTHVLQVEGIIVRGGADQTWYSASPSVIVAAGQTTTLPVALDVVAAQGTFVPTFEDGSAFSCGTTVGALFIELFDRNNDCLTDAKGVCGFFDDCAKFEAGFAFDYLPVKQTFDTVKRQWTATWTARIEGWDRAASNPRVLYQGTASPIIAAASNDRYLVPLTKK